MAEREEETIVDLRASDGLADDPEFNPVASHEDSILPQTKVESGEGHRPLRGTQRPPGWKLLIFGPTCSRDRCCLLSVVGLTTIVIVVIAAVYMNSGLQSDGFLFHDSQKKSIKQDAITVSGEKFPWNDVRLPSTVVPYSYRIHLQPNLTTFKFTGKVDINITVVKTTYLVVFHVKGLNITQSSIVKTSNQNPVPIKSEMTYDKNEQYGIQLVQHLNAATNYTMTVHFQGELKDRMYGFYKSTYTTKKTPDGKEFEPKVLAMTQFEPAYARAAFPCFDEPAMKATFQLQMVRETKYSTLFNMPKDHTVDLDGGLKMDVFQESVPVSTYLVAFIVSEFKTLSDTTPSGIRVAVHATEDNIAHAGYALTVTKAVLQYYETFFGVPYPLPKLDVVAIPEFSAGAMENWGLVTFRESYMLYNEKQSSARDKQYMTLVIAHELAQQWFGNLVTMKWWNDLWLNEGFASYVENIGVDSVSPKWKMMDQFLTDKTQIAISADSLSNSHPISAPVHRPEEVEEVFDSISYDKGASILRMLESFLGRETFLRGLTAYLEKHKFNNADADDLWKALEQAFPEDGKSNMNIKNMMDTWTNQIGYPVVTVTRENSNIHLKQERFLLTHQAPAHACCNEVESTSPYGYEWTIPLTYVTSTLPDAQKTAFMNSNSSVVAMETNSANWVKFNVNQTGFYRVNYDPVNWDALIGQLQTNHQALNSADRAGLLDDAFHLVRAGYLELQKSLELLKYLKNEREYVPLSTALNGLGYMAGRLETQRDKDVFNNMKIFILDLLEDVVGEVGWEDQGDQLTKLLRRSVLAAACRYGHQESIQQAHAIFVRWMQSGGAQAVPPNLKTVVYVSGVEHGGQAEWEFCWQQYASATAAAEKSELLYALTRTKDPKLLEKLLDYSLDSTKMLSQDTVATITNVAQTSVGSQMAWDFVKKNWQTLHNRYGSDSFDFSRLILRTTSHFSTSKQLVEVTEFFLTHHLGGSARAASQTLELIQANIYWLGKYKDKAKTWLEQNVMSSDSE